MLSSIREKATGWIAWIIVIIIVIPFALWGINSYFEGPSSLLVAEVNGQEIDEIAYRNALDNRRSAIRSSWGQNIDLDFLDQVPFKTQVVEGLISDRLLLVDAETQGYRIGDAHLGALIRAIPQFQTDGEFDEEAYNYTVRNIGLTVSGFEENQRRQTMINQVARSYQQSAIVTDADIDLILMLEYQIRTADYLLFANSDYQSSIVVSDRDIQAEYEKNIDAYQDPARVKVEYIELSVAELMRQITIDEAEIRQAYEQTKRQYTDPEERRASHILLTLKPDVDEGAENAVLAKARELLQELRDGADFSAMAQSHSEDPGSKGKGGDLGVITPGAMVKPFEEAVLSLASGEISEPVRTTYGYHIIKLTELVPAKILTYEAVRDQVEKGLKNRQAENRFLDLSESFRNLVYEQPDSLQPAADELDLQIQESDWFSKAGGGGIASFPNVQEAAFSDDVLNNGLNSEAVEAGVDTLVSVRRLDYQDSGARPLEEVSETIRQRLVDREAAEAARNRGEAILNEIRQGSKSWGDVVAESGLQAEFFEGRRSEAVTAVEGGLVNSLFAAARPGVKDKPVYGGIEITTDGYLVYQLNTVQDGNPADIETADRDRVRQQILRRRGSDVYASYRDELRNAADIKIYTEQL